MKNKKLRIVASALSLVICVAACVLLWWEMSRPQRVEVPVPGLSWGMTDLEAEMALQKAGLNTSIASGDGAYGTKSYGLRAEDLAVLGFDGIGTLTASSEEFKPVVLEFTSHADGYFRLTGVRIVAEVPGGSGMSSMEVKQAVEQVMKSLYGSKTVVDTWYIAPGLLASFGTQKGLPPDVWTDYSGTRVGEVKLEYRGLSYVLSLYGGE